MQVALNEFKPEFKPDADGATPLHLQLTRELMHSWSRSAYYDFIAELRR